MKKYLPLVLLVFAALACSLPARTQPAASNPTPDGSQPMPGDSVSTASPASGATGSGSMSLRIVSPLDGTVVNTSIVEIVGADGVFKHIVTLEEGPNVIEILASDASGNESFFLLAIFYEP